MFHIYTFFHQMVSLDDTILEWEYYIFHAYTIWHYVDTGFDDILCKYNRDLVLLVAGNCQPCHNFSYFLDISAFDIFYQFQHFIGTFFLIFYFNIRVFFAALSLKIFLHLRIFLVPHFLIVYFNFRIFLYLRFWYASCISGFSWYYTFCNIIFDVRFSRYLLHLYCFIDSFFYYYIFFSCISFLLWIIMIFSFLVPKSLSRLAANCYFLVHI